MDLREKLEKEEKKLKNLKEQRATLDEKIKKVEKEIEKCTNVLNQQKFSEVTQVLHAKGLTIDEILNAVRTGDVLALQERMEKLEESAKYETAEMGTETIDMGTESNLEELGE